MNFIKKEIEANIIGIIDIGSYKIRVAITQYKNKDLDLIGYGEKRQENSFDNESLITIYENINDGIKKAENDGKIDIQDIIINIPFGEIFYEYSKVNYLRKNTSSPIDKKELGEIIEYTKEIALRKAFTNIENNHSYQQNDLKLIITSINKILIDKKETKKLLGENPSEVNITLSNIFIPKNKYRSIQELGNVLKKNIIKIIPSEYSIAHLHFGEKDIVIIDLGSTHTSIIVKINHTIIGMK